MRSEGTSQNGLSSWHLIFFAGIAVKIVRLSIPVAWV